MSLVEIDVIDGQSDELYKHAAWYANTHYYTKGLTQAEVAGHNFSWVGPIIHNLHRVQGSDENPISADIRRSHGFLHVTAAADRLADIDKLYRDLDAINPQGYQQSMATLAEHFFSVQQSACIDEAPEWIVADNNHNTTAFLELIKVAVLFHDSGRQGDGDGDDEWDNVSANNLEQYLTKFKEQIIARYSLKQENYDELVLLLKSAVAYKDDKHRFLSALNTSNNTDSMLNNSNSEFIRQLVNMADSLEVMRCRDDYCLDYTPACQTLVSAGDKDNQPQMYNQVGVLARKHYTQIVAEGRASKATRLSCKDKAVILPELKGGGGYDMGEIGQTYQRRGLRLGTAMRLNLNTLSAGSVSEAKFNDDGFIKTITPDVYDKVIEGIEVYLNTKANKGLDWTSHSSFKYKFFGLRDFRYHGTQGYERALYYQSKFAAADTAQNKATALYALLSGNHGTTLKECVLSTLGRNDVDNLLSELSASGLVQVSQVEGMIRQAEGKDDRCQLLETIRQVKPTYNEVEWASLTAQQSKSRMNSSDCL